ncbi:MAG: metal-sulfur cluster assembly factor [Actinomycetota bacterium]
MSEANDWIEAEPRAAAAVDRTPAAATVSDGHPEGTGGTNGQGTLTKDDVLEALKSVIDPELGINIVDLGLVYEVDISEGNVHVTYTLTTMGCPIGPLVEAQMHELIDPLPGIDSFEAEMVLRPPWSPEMMSEEAKEALGYF